MKDLLYIIIFCFLFSYVSLAQALNQSENKGLNPSTREMTHDEGAGIRFYGFTVIPFGFYTDDHTSGILFGIDGGINIEEHIVKARFLLGGEVALFASDIETNAEISLSYGREFRLKDWLYVDAFAGIGYFHHDTPPDRNGIETNVTTVGFPLELRTRFQVGERFALALPVHSNINSENIIYTISLGLQWRF